MSSLIYLACLPIYFKLFAFISILSSPIVSSSALFKVSIYAESSSSGLNFLIFILETLYFN